MFIFIIDNHPSMGLEKGKQRSALDMSKASIEAFLSVYSKIPQGQQGTNPLPLMLLDSGLDKSCILSHLTDPVLSFESKMKNYVVREMEGQGTAISRPTNFSYSISLAFSILNKLRIKNETDRFGYGRCPWSLEPASIFLFTNGNPQNGQEFDLVTRWKTLSEFVSHVYKWDHRVFLFVMFNQNEAGKCTVPSHLASLCAITGGEVIICRTMKDAHDSAKNLSNRILSSHPSVAVKFTVVDSNKGETIVGNSGNGDGDAGGSSAEEIGGVGVTDSVLGVGARMLVKSVGEWPIPEQGWIDIRDVNGKLPIRDAIPLLSVLKGNTPAVATSKAMLQLAKESDVHADTYEITINGGKPLELDKNEAYPVYVNSSWRHLLSSSSGVEASSSTANHPEPFAILTTSGKVGVYQLVVLPFNFPKCLQLLKQVLEPLKAGKTTQDLNLQPWMSQWRNDVTGYLQTVPPYYYPPMARLLKKHQILKLAFPGNQQNVLDYELHRKPGQRIKKAQSEALGDITSMDAVARDQWSKHVTHVNIVVLATSVHAHQSLPVGAGTLSMPKSVCDVHESDLLSVWEKMRQSIFGGGTGLTVRGLAVQGVVGTSGRIAKQSVDLNSGGDWFQQACGGSRVPLETTRDMSNYFSVLAHQECLRDPNLLDASVDEDSELGVLKRKLSPPNFGNRYGGKKAAKTGMEIEGIVPGNEGLFQSAPGVPTEIRKQAQISLLEDTANASVHALFMDTPAPYLDDGYLESVDSTNSDGMDVVSSINTDNTEGVTNKPEGLESDTSVQSYSRETATLPKLGKPSRRPPRPHSLPYTASIAVATTAPETAGSSVANPPSSNSSSSTDTGMAAVQVPTTGTPSSSSGGLIIVQNANTGEEENSSGASNSSPSTRSPISVTATSMQSPSSSNGSPSPGSTPASSSASPGSEEWVKHFSAKHNRPYWFSTVTGKSVWTDPAL